MLKSSLVICLVFFFFQVVMSLRIDYFCYSEEASFEEQNKLTDHACNAVKEEGKKITVLNCGKNPGKCCGVFDVESMNIFNNKCLEYMADMVTDSEHKDIS